jgi:imidazolonepropionase-like amidohydrolase
MARATSDTLDIVGARVLNERGTFVSRDSVRISNGRFVDFGPGAPESHPLDATGMWLIPGVYDCHTHISWSDFHREDRERRAPEERMQQTTDALAATLRGGVTSLRDAGGADAKLRDAVADGSLPGPRLQISIDMIGAADAGGPAKIQAAVERALAKGADWIKLVATAGSTTPGDSVLESKLSKEEISTAIRSATRGGARVMVHTWGGDSADWVIEAGAASIEHGIYMNQEQVSRAAEAGMTLVPTITIYRHVRDMISSGQLSGVPIARITDVIAAHETVVKIARDTGLPLAMGCDFTVLHQHGTNLVEIAALMRAGLTSSDALLAATRNGAQLFSDADGGVIAPGFRADAVLLRSDPSDPATFEDSGNVAIVIKDGNIVHPAPTAVPPAPLQRQ